MSARDRKLHEYRLRLEAEAAEHDQDEEAPDDAAGRARRLENQTRWVELQIQQAMRNGEFDNLPGAGKPIRGIDAPHDPDWWLKRLIEREGITGVLPPALALRTEDAGMDDRLDRETTRDGVRRVVEEFNARIVDARRQLQGGPPVITPLRGVDDEVRRWDSRRAARIARQQAVLEQIRLEEKAAAPPPWWRRLLDRLRAGRRRLVRASAVAGTLVAWSRHRELSLSRELRLEQHVNVSLTLALLRRGAGDPTTRRDGSRLWRTSRMSAGPVTYVLQQIESTLVRAEAWGPGADELLDGLPALIGAEDDMSGFRPDHPILTDGFRRHPGLRVPRTGRVLEALMAAVIEQKVVGLDAFAAWRRLHLRFGEPAPGPAPSGMRVFPTAEQWAAIPSWEWHRAGVDPQRARTAQACARVGSQVDRLATTHPDDHAAVYRGLRSIPGVGAWTAAEVGSRALGDADAVPFGDFHVAKDVGVALVGRPLDDPGLADLLEPWRPHRYRVVQLVRLSPLARPERRGPRMPRVDHRHI